MAPLLLSLLNKEAFERYCDVARGQMKTDETKEILRALEVVHEQTDDDLTLEGLALGLATCYPAKRADVLADIVRGWKGMAVDPGLVENYFKDTVQKAKAYDIAIAAGEVFEGKRSWDDLQAMLSNEQIEVTPEFEFVSHNLSALLERQEARGGFKWRLNALNGLLGHLPRKTFGFIFARPDTGKTALLASEVTNFLLQTTDPVLWIANEEDADVVKTRCFQAIYGVSMARLYANVVKYQEDYEKRFGSRLMISGDPKLNTKGALERAVKHYKPGVVVVDQLDKLRGFKNDRRELQLGDTYAWFRALTIAHNFAGIGVTQANSQAEGKKWLTMDNIADGHTSKPAEADWILGIGKTFLDDKERYLHTPKDKLPLSEGKLSGNRHGKATVMFSEETGRFEDYAS